jgi:hypothetical protein
MSDGIAIDESDMMAEKRTAKFSTNFQISIPKSIWKAQRWSAG